MKTWGYFLVIVGVIVQLGTLFYDPITIGLGSWLTRHLSALWIDSFGAIFIGVALVIANGFLEKPHVVTFKPTPSNEVSAPVQGSSRSGDKHRRDQCCLCGKTKEQVRKLIVGLHG